MSIRFTIGTLFTGVLVAAVVSIISYSDHQHHGFALEMADRAVHRVGRQAIEKTTRYLDNGAVAAETVAQTLAAEPTLLTRPVLLRAVLAGVMQTHDELASCYVGLPDGTLHQV